MDLEAAQALRDQVRRPAPKDSYEEDLWHAEMRAHQEEVMQAGAQLDPAHEARLTAALEAPLSAALEARLDAACKAFHEKYKEKENKSDLSEESDLSGESGLSDSSLEDDAAVEDSVTGDMNKFEDSFKGIAGRYRLIKRIGEGH